MKDVKIRAPAGVEQVSKHSKYQCALDIMTERLADCLDKNKVRQQWKEFGRGSVKDIKKQSVGAPV